GKRSISGKFLGERGDPLDEIDALRSCVENRIDADHHDRRVVIRGDEQPLQKRLSLQSLAELVFRAIRIVDRRRNQLAATTHDVRYVCETEDVIDALQD